MFARSFLIATAFVATAAMPACADDLTDSQIAHIAYTAGQIDVAQAELALKKSHNPDVIAFAELMKRDHQAVNEQALALVTKLGVTPEDNDTSKALSAAATETAKRLEGLSGADFDKAYVENEVAYHQTVNGALKDALIPSSDNAELKALLETGLALFQSHQTHAETVAAAVK